MHDVGLFDLTTLTFSLPINFYFIYITIQLIKIILLVI